VKILVVGGAGYIGSHAVKKLSQRGYSVVVLDDLSTGFSNSIISGQLVLGSMADKDILKKILREHKISAVMNFASFINVGESVIHPEKYYLNNVSATLNLLTELREGGINKMIFSSSAAVYGNPVGERITENHPTLPINPYGQSKLLIEKVLCDYELAYKFKSIRFRYFNAAGADPDGSLGERHYPETHLIPLVLQTASGRRKKIDLYGTDYDTPDGTCIRDYIHVDDLCEAHALGLEKLLKGSNSATYNLGNENGYSVKEVLTAAESITGKIIATEFQKRRTGDPSRLIANSTKAKKELGWRPKYESLEKIISDAWAWEQKFPWN
jgi:UDP-glucose 4-epimerase